MICSNCGAQLGEGLKFCPYCGTTVLDYNLEQNDASLYQTQEFAQETSEISKNNEFGMYNRGIKTEEKQTYYEEEPQMYKSSYQNIKKQPQKNIWLIVGAVVLSIAVITVGILLLVLGSWDKNDAKNNEEYNCKICGEETDNKEEYCDDCIEDYGCKYCDAVIEDISIDGFCEDCKVEYTCRACDKVDEEVEDGYCPDCAEDMKCKGKGCKEIVEEGHYCADCIDSLLNEEYDGLCFACSDHMDTEDIFLIDTLGYAYCEDCDTGNYCSKCNAYIEKYDDDDVCFFCAEHACFNCSEVLETSEIYVTDDYGNDYCEDCDAGYYCESCGAPVRRNRTYCNECDR